MPTVTKTELLGLAGTAAEPSEWFRIDQERVNLFADATLDHQFIHIDPERAAKTPFGSTIAHGFLSLSLLSHFKEQVDFVPENLAMAINYGLNKVRFLQPVKVGSEVRLVAKVLDVVEKKPGHVLVTGEATLEIKGEAKPAFVAETLVMYVLNG